MRILEKICIGIAVVGMLMKFNFLFGGDILIIISLGSLSLLYYVFGFALFNSIKLRKIFSKEGYKNTNYKRIIGAIIVGMVLSNIVLGVVFDIENYSGSVYIQYIGIISGSIVAFVVIFKLIKSKSKFYKNILIRLLPSLAISCLLLSISNSDLIKFQFRNHPKYVEAYENYLMDTSNGQLKYELLIERDRVYYGDEFVKEVYKEE